MFYRFLFIFTLVVFPSISFAETYIVTKTEDTLDGTCDADCSFREALTASNNNAGFDTIEFNIPESDPGYIPPDGSTQGYFVIDVGANSLTLSDNDGVFINGYSQSGAQRNSAPFGETINTILKIRLEGSLVGSWIIVSGANNHISGLNIKSPSSTSINMTGAGSNWIEGNFLGTDITGLITNEGWGTIQTSNSSSNNIIGTNGDGIGDVGERNLIVRNQSNNASVGAQFGTNNIVAGNYIGVDRTGRVCGTGTMNRQHIFFSTSGNRLGSNFDGISDTEESNIIACINNDARALVRVDGSGVVAGNYIGTNTHGDDLNSSFVIPGVSDNFGANEYLIKRNVIAHNGSYGIGIRGNSGTATGNTFSENSIYENGDIGIDLVIDGVTLNDAGDVDIGMNDLMNFPVIKKAGLSANNNLMVVVDLDFDESEGPFILEFFANEDIDNSGYGEGQYFIGSVETSSVGSDIVLTIPVTGFAPDSVDKITSTATNSNGSTSEFSAPPEDTVTYSTVSSASILINNDEDSTEDASVVLSISAIGEFSLIDRMRISNTEDFENTTCEAFAENKDWLLSSGSGEKTVYIKFKDIQENESIVFSDQILFISDEIIETEEPEENRNRGIITGSTALGRVVNLFKSGNIEEARKLVLQFPDSFKGTIFAILFDEKINCDFKFEKVLKKGMIDDEVKKLQIFLNQNGFTVANIGFGSQGNETNYFGALTEVALKRFQEANAKDILWPLGLKNGTGILGPSTIKFINSLYSN